MLLGVPLGNPFKRTLGVNLHLCLSTDVAFSAKIVGNIEFNGGNKIVFDDVITNVGSSYDETTGIFMAPHNGTYQFTVITITTSGVNYAWITVNGERVIPALAVNSDQTG